MTVDEIRKHIFLHNDNSYDEYKESLLFELREIRDNFSTHSMNDGALVLQGEKAMLSAIIQLIENN